MRKSLDIVASENRPSHLSPDTLDAPEQNQNHHQPLLRPPGQSAPGPPSYAPTNTPDSINSHTGAASTREENTQMAMTRENSTEPATGVDYSDRDLANAAVTVGDPMNSLYEVTRLRNIRSGSRPAKTVCRASAGGEEEINDFISRGVLSEAEAEDLYK